MLRILLVTTRREAIHPFIDGLTSDPEVHLDLATSGVEALGAVRTGSLHLVIIDYELPDMGALSLVLELLMVNAMVNTAVVSPLSDQELHDASEGLGVLARLPLIPGKDEAGELLRKLRRILIGSTSDVRTKSANWLQQSP